MKSSRRFFPFKIYLVHLFLKKDVVKRLILFCCFLLSCIGLRAQEFVTRQGFVSFFGQKPFESVRANNHEVQASIDTKTGAIEFHTFIKSFHFKKKSFEEAFR